MVLQAIDEFFFRGLPKNLWVVARYDLTTKRKKSSRFREKTTFKGCTARK
jgi:hypothetical protein